MSRYQRSVDFQDLVLTLAGSRHGVTIDEICQRYQVSRRTGERMRDAVAARFAVVEVQRTPGDRRKRWRIEASGIRELARFEPNHDAILDEAAEKLECAGLGDLAESVRRIAERMRVLG